MRRDKEHANLCKLHLLSGKYQWDDVVHSRVLLSDLLLIWGSYLIYHRFAFLTKSGSAQVPSINSDPLAKYYTHYEPDFLFQNHPP